MENQPLIGSNVAKHTHEKQGELSNEIQTRTFW